MGRDAAGKLATPQQEGDTRTLSEGRHCELRQQRCRIHANNLGKGQKKTILVGSPARRAELPHLMWAAAAAAITN